MEHSTVAYTLSAGLWGTYDTSCRLTLLYGDIDTNTLPQAHRRIWTLDSQVIHNHFKAISRLGAWLYRRQRTCDERITALTTRLSE